MCNPPEIIRSWRQKSAPSLSSLAANNMIPFTSTKKSRASIEQYNADAGLLAEFEQSGVLGESFDYSRSVRFAPQTVSDEQITDYLNRIQRGGLIQSFGCMIAIEEPNFKIIGYSENCYELLGLNSVVDFDKGLIGIDARTLFIAQSGASLSKATFNREISLLNPILVQTKSTQKPFYAILHRIDVGIVIDLEPALSGDPALSLAGVVQSQKLAVHAISRLQSLPGGDIGVLFDTVVEDVQRLTGYDRVMVYRFHDDEHGEVVAEIRRSDLEPYLGLHYPAVDIPQAARFLFKQNHVRIICDCHASHVKVIQSNELKQPLLLVNSTLRSPYDCHTQYMTNMGSIASLVMSIVINENNLKKLWGLVVCHHTTPRYVPFPLRYACEFLMQAFGLQLRMELQLAAELAEKKSLQTQTLLCDMLLRDVPSSIITQSPNIMDLVKCDGAALYYGERCWLLGVTPNESQVKDIAKWLLNDHKDSTGLSTDSLVDSGYPGASLLGDDVCGMAAAKISSKDLLFWFRSHAGKEVKWGGAEHHPGDQDDGGKMHPRSSFKIFLEAGKNRSLPWEVSEINAIHSLQLILMESFQGMEDSSSKKLVYAQQSDAEKRKIVELSLTACEMVRMIETATIPIFGVDTEGLINGWNSKVAALTGLQVNEAMGKSLVQDIAHKDSREAVENLLRRALLGMEDRNVELKLRKFSPHQQNSFVYIEINACTSRDYVNNIIGACFVGQDITPEKLVMNKFIRLQRDYEAIVQSLNPLIPPIFASDENACCSEWNATMEKLTGWTRQEVIGKVLPGRIFGGLCQLKDQDSLTQFMILLYRAISGQDNTKLPFGFFNREGKFVEVFLIANRRIGADGKVIGCFCFLQTIQIESSGAEDGPKQEDRGSFLRQKECAYIRQEIKNPLSGIRFARQLFESTTMSEHQKLFLDTSGACERQIMTVIEDADFEKILEGNVDFNTVEFLLENAIDPVISQVMTSLSLRNIQLRLEISEEMKILSLYGDQIRLQLILSDFLRTVVHHTPPNGWIGIEISRGLKLIQDDNECIRLHFRIGHSGPGLPSALIKDMFDEGNQCAAQEGLGLNLSRKLLNGMRGHVQYGREQNKCYFIIDLEMKLKKGIPTDLQAAPQSTMAV